MHNRSFALLLSLFLALTGCVERQPPPAPPPPAAPPPAAPPPASSALSLGERLQQEAGTRPAGKPRVEDVRAALQAQGFPVERWKQVLATPVGARFCMAGQTAQGVGVAVCEYGSAQDAAAGLARSHATFDRLIPNRQLSVNRQTLLTLTRPSAEPALAAHAQDLARIFAAL